MAEKDFESPLDTTNERWFDAMIRHQIFLLRMSGGLKNKINDLLAVTEIEIVEKIKAAKIGQGFGPQSLKRLENLLKEINGIRSEAWDEVGKVWIKDMAALAVTEPVIVAGILKTVVPVIIEPTIPSPEILKSIVKTRPFEGRLLKDWTKNIKASDIARIDAEIKKGIVQGESNAEIARRVVGTPQLKGKDGVTEISRRNAQALTRTSTNAIANQARREFFKANEDLFTEEQYIATLDARTTPICRSLDGEKFPIGKGPIPPLHINCRSLRVAVIDDVEMGMRPMKTTTTKGLLRKFTKENNLKNVTSRKDLPRGFKGKFDKFSRAEIRKGTGRVSGKTTYQQFLSRQSKEFQQDVLGKTKAKLFRDGDLTLDKFVNRVGDELNLDQLARKHKDAFSAAGLDAKDFL